MLLVYANATIVVACAACRWVMSGNKKKLRLLVNNFQLNDNDIEWIKEVEENGKFTYERKIATRDTGMIEKTEVKALEQWVLLAGGILENRGTGLFEIGTKWTFADEYLCWKRENSGKCVGFSLILSKL